MIKNILLHGVYLASLVFFSEVAYQHGLQAHTGKIEQAQQLCKAGKYEEAYVAFAYDGMRCFKESTQYPHRAKGYSIVYDLNNEEEQ